MNIYLEAGTGFKSGKDVYGNEIVGSGETVETIRACADELGKDPEVANRSIRLIQVSDASAVLEEISGADLLVSIHFNFYRDSGGVGLRGYYRSTSWGNSERCKALAITITKALRDHVDMYYHGVYNEQKDKHIQLDPIVKCKATACLVEVGFNEEFKDKVREPAVHKNIGAGIARGISRHLTSQH